MPAGKKSVQVNDQQLIKLLESSELAQTGITLPSLYPE
jgi:hypothetical protein